MSSRDSSGRSARGSGEAGDARVCVACGRTIAWRKKWAANWDEVRYCSDACRRRKVRPVDRALEEGIVDLLARRAASLGQIVAPDDWRPPVSYTHLTLPTNREV